jgi:hypothetical protein
MRIGIVGGIERNEPDYRAIAERSGHRVSFHSGHVGGRGSACLVDLVATADLVIVLTDVNSHGAVILARRSARKRGTRLELHRRYSPARFAELVATIQ